MISIKPRTKAPPTADQCISFDITNGNRRVACTLTTNFPTREQATRYFLANRPLVETMARKQMADVGLDDGNIALVVV